MNYNMFENREENIVYEIFYGKNRDVCEVAISSSIIVRLSSCKLIVDGVEYHWSACQNYNDGMHFFFSIPKAICSNRTIRFTCNARDIAWIEIRNNKEKKEKEV